ncbi:MAG: hypothetical protein R3A47_03565 [Polyangiales bacterium]
MLLPWSLGGAFSELGPYGVWLSIPVTVLVRQVYLMMELVGDYSEHFHGMANGIPMLALCRTIEIGLKSMLKEPTIPPPIESRNGVLL